MPPEAAATVAGGTSSHDKAAAVPRMLSSKANGGGGVEKSFGAEASLQTAPLPPGGSVAAQPAPATQYMGPDSLPLVRRVDPPPPATAPILRRPTNQEAAAQPSVAGKKSYKHRKEIQHRAGLALAHKDDESDSLLPIKFKMVREADGQGVMKTEWEEHKFTMTAVASEWREPASYVSTGTKHAKKPKDASLFKTGCCQNFLAPTDLLNPTARSKMNAADAAEVIFVEPLEGDKTIGKRADLNLAISVRIARMMMNYCVGMDIAAPDNKDLGQVNAGITWIMGENARVLTADEVLTVRFWQPLHS